MSPDVRPAAAAEARLLPLRRKLLSAAAAATAVHETPGTAATATHSRVAARRPARPTAGASQRAHSLRGRRRSWRHAKAVGTLAHGDRTDWTARRTRDAPAMHPRRTPKRHCASSARQQRVLSTSRASPSHSLRTRRRRRPAGRRERRHVGTRRLAARRTRDAPQDAPPGPQRAGSRCIGCDQRQQARATAAGGTPKRRQPVHAGTALVWRRDSSAMGHKRHHPMHSAAKSSASGASRGRPPHTPPPPAAPR